MDEFDNFINDYMKHWCKKRENDELMIIDINQWIIDHNSLKLS